MSFLRRLQAFLFKPISAKGFGLMRVFWGGSALFFYLTQWTDVRFFYSEAGILPRAYGSFITRHIDRFTLLDFTGDPHAVFALYLLFLVCLCATMLGVFPRLSTILSYILMASFHERNPLILGGGDTVFRLIGFLLCIAPTLRAFSLDRLADQWKYYHKTKQLLPDLTMSIWPYRLLLWQVICIYIASDWYKLMGTMWLSGTATTAALQHEVFARWPQSVMHLFIPAAPFITYLTLAFEVTWTLLLIPRSFTRWSLAWEFQPRLKRWLLLLGFCFHLGIFLLMDVGTFSIAMFVAFSGLLLQEDFNVLRRLINRTHTGSIRVFYDGNCGLCLRSLFGLRILDWLGRLSPVNFRDENARKAAAPDLTLATLATAMHVRFPSGTTLNGFDAFRALAWHLPATWLLAPLLYIPGVPPIGRRIYACIADSRKTCNHESCAL